MAAFAGVDVAIHLAWVLNPIKDAMRMTEVNLGGTRHFLDACARHGVRRVLVASSTTAYGARPSNPVPLDESHPVRGEQPFQYAREKAVMEGLVRRVADNDRLKKATGYRYLHDTRSALLAYKAAFS